MRVEWRDDGGRTRLLGVTELGRMMGTDPSLALSVLEGMGRREAGKSAEGMNPQRKGWGRLQDRAEETSSSSSTTTTTTTTSSGRRTPSTQGPQNPPPRPPRKNPATWRVARKSPPPPPQAQQSKPKAKAKPHGQGKGKATSPKKPQAPPLAR